MEFRAQARLHARLAAEGTPGAGPDQGPRGGRRAATRCCSPRSGWRPTVEKLLRSAMENANLPEHREESRRRCRPAVREERGGQRRSAHEAHSSGADGTGVPVRAAHRAHRDRAGGAEQERRDSWRRWWAKKECRQRPRRQPRARPRRRAKRSRWAQEESGRRRKVCSCMAAPEQIKEQRWVKKFILTDSGSATPSRGSRAGLSSGTTTSCCSKT